VGAKSWVRLTGLLLTVLFIATCCAFAQTAPAKQSQPTLSYSHYVLGPLDRVHSAAVGVDGTLYLAGVSLAKAAQIDPSQSFAGEGSAFVAHLSADGSKLLYLSYLDKSGLSEARSLAVDGAGNVYVTGATRAENFPTLHALRSQCARNGSGECYQDAFVAMLDRNGATVFATRLGATGDTAGNAIALDSKGDIFVGGSTDATDFATSTAAQTAAGGSGDGFVASLSADGSTLRFVSYLGGSGTDEVRGLAIAHDGAAVVTGTTSSSDFPTRNALQPQCRTAGNNSCDQAFAAKLSSDGTKFEYSTYVGGSGHNSGNAIAVDVDGYVYVAGTTDSTDFPGLRSAQPVSGSNDAFVVKIAPDGSALAFATLLGGKGSDRANAIALDSSGNVHVAGSTQSLDFPTHNPLQSSCAKKNDGSCSVDGFVAVLDAEGKQLHFSTYLGGRNSDLVRAVSVDRQGSAYVAGWTSSPDFPTSEKSAQAGSGQKSAGSFVAKITGMGPASPQVTCGGGSNNWTGTAGDNQWTTPTNWSTGAVPVATDNVCIASTFTSVIAVASLSAANQTIASLVSGAPLSFQTGPLTISGTATFAADLAIPGGAWTLNAASTMTTLELSGGILAGSGNVTISGLLTWSGGELCTTQSAGSCTAPGTNATTTASGGVNFSGVLYIDGRTLTTAKTSTNPGRVSKVQPLLPALCRRAEPLPSDSDPNDYRLPVPARSELPDEDSAPRAGRDRHGFPTGQCRNEQRAAGRQRAAGAPYPGHTAQRVAADDRQLARGHAVDRLLAGYRAKPDQARRRECGLHQRVRALELHREERGWLLVEPLPIHAVSQRLLLRELPQV